MPTESPTPVRIEQTTADAIEDFGTLGGATVDAMIHGDFEHFEAEEVSARPCGERGAIADADPRGMPLHCRADLFITAPR